jgi:hypothetical protein
VSRADRIAAIRARQAALRARLREKRKPRRRWWWLVLLLLILLALLCCCGCPDEPEVPPEELVFDGKGVVVEVPEPEVPLDRTPRRDRPDFENKPADPLKWIDAFRLQVAARSPRLAECFVGADQPGTLKWTVSVEPGSGKVSDHVLEPTLGSADLTSEQRACVLGVLSDPPYRLEVAERSTPSRIGMAIEF